MPKIKIDGKEIEFKQGQTIIEAAKDHGIEIAHFCWHPKLSVSGNCRMCLVEVEKMPKLVIACATTAADGMVVRTQSDKSLAARNAVMEFFLINHPLDCPICDEAGECKLQDYTYKHSVGESRFVEEKVKKGKRIQIGPYVMFDADRCIMCSRCIRFCDEIAKDPELTFTKRGDRVFLTTYPGEKLDNLYSMNVVDICPVGALTNSDFRFKSRVWEMSLTNSVCTGCARGCNIELWVRNNEVLRLVPKYNEDVNSYWMCDHGRVNTFKFVNAKDRVDGPHIRVEGNLVRVGWDEAYAEAASRLKGFSKDEIAVLGSAFATVEDNYAAAKFAKSVLGTGNLDFVKHVDPAFGDDILRKNDITPNSFGAELAGVKPSKNGNDFNGIIKGIKEGKIKALYILEDDIIAANTELESVFAKLDLLIAHATNFNKTTVLADIVFPASTYAEKNGTFVNFSGRVQRIRPAVATLDVDRALEGMSMSRWDKFGTKFDRWAQGKHFDARASWKILVGLASALGQKMKYGMAEEVFLDLAANIEAFNGLDYDTLGEFGVQLNNLNSKPSDKN
ncbi:MAG: molybdopterin-dependent oxidoreductase [Ignavibacteriota bacterium]|nr:NADH-quinone oxidoreductase subunit G [Ignavibacteriota bacterium]MCO6448067.1 molybdopterin-dependent oxidoreductase [Ignavibacterium album]MCZ2268825.1 molybdopterin-dependent oxidoreductase [Ignavibacteriales bacterium]QKJ98382.1 MAG: molybdopterin-dependent oxidoreductase [Ignavibacteriota bacterium]HOJ07748.1 molybdopterin-dependent oxidoreductase [Ignavibacteriaceae bacterium]